MNSMRREFILSRGLVDNEPEYKILTSSWYSSKLGTYFLTS